ncbi:MAG: deoxyribose-phosphate aldolase, partial [Synergistaceae bacterium]|nr:deoxyribose-phosphate aldolase [Synergistaceae bacterium]
MNIAQMIDHTNLSPDATHADIEKLCAEAREWKFASVCVNSAFAAYAAKLLKGSGVKVCCVVGFPLGANADGAKAFEAAAAAKGGADEIDMVINISYLKDREYDKLLGDIESVVDAVPDCVVKVIIEACLLTDEEKVKACELAKEAGAHFVKTSTGFS